MKSLSCIVFSLGNCHSIDLTQGPCSGYVHVLYRCCTPGITEYCIYIVLNTSIHPSISLAISLSIHLPAGLPASLSIRLFVSFLPHGIDSDWSQRISNFRPWKCQDTMPQRHSTHLAKHTILHGKGWSNAARVCTVQTYLRCSDSQTQTSTK